MHDRRLMSIVPRQIPEHPEAAATTHSTDALPNDTAASVWGGTSAWKRLNAIPAGVTALVGAAGSSRETYPAWWGAAALALFPASLAVVWGLDTFLGWQ